MKRKTSELSKRTSGAIKQQASALHGRPSSTASWAWRTWLIATSVLMSGSGCTSGNDPDATEPNTSGSATPMPTGVLTGDPGVFEPPASGSGKGNGPNPNTVISANPVGCNGDGESFSGVHQSCYRVVSIPALTWAQASIDCTLWSAGSGHLVSVANAAENEYVRNLVGGTHVWLGASDAKEESAWVWLSGEAWFYQAFASARPDNLERSEHCLSMLNDGTWDDASCGAELPYVCERTFAQ